MHDTRGKIVEYRCVKRSDVSELNDVINTMIKAGWHLYEGPSLSTSNNFDFTYAIQAVVKYEPQDE